MAVIGDVTVSIPASSIRRGVLFVHVVDEEQHETMTVILDVNEARDLAEQLTAGARCLDLLEPSDPNSEPF